MKCENCDARIVLVGCNWFHLNNKGQLVDCKKVEEKKNEKKA